MTDTEATRCAWATGDAMVHYHDTEWGVPSHDDQHLFEMLVLEGAQAGLSWSTILNKREGYRLLFKGFDIDKVARFTEKDVEQLVGDARIVRNRAKISSAVPPSSTRKLSNASRRSTARSPTSCGRSSATNPSTRPAIRRIRRRH